MIKDLEMKESVSFQGLLSKSKTKVSICLHLSLDKCISESKTKVLRFAKMSDINFIVF